MNDQKWQCSKCASTDGHTEQIRVSGSRLAAFFDMQDKKYVAVVCDRCGFVELYKRDSSTLGNIIDLLGS